MDIIPWDLSFREKHGRTRVLCNRLRLLEEEGARCVDAVGMHEVEGTQPQLKVERLPWWEFGTGPGAGMDKVPFFCVTDGEDACGGEPLLTGQGEEQAWNNSVMAEVLSQFTPVISKDVHMRRKRMLGQRMCGRVTELLRMNRKANHGGTTVIVTLCGKVRVVATRLSWQKFQQHEMH